METEEWTSIGMSKPETDTYFQDLDKNSNENNENNENNQSHSNIGNLEDIDQMFLNHLEHNLYDSSTMNSHRETKVHHVTNSRNTDNTDINIHMLSGSIDGVPGELSNHMNFMVSDDLDLDSKSYDQSSAYPPSNLPSHTPNLVGSKSLSYTQNANNRMLVSPILPGQNDKSYNEQHLYHKHNRSRNQTQLYSIRPDAVFTPLVSPAVTPMDSQINVNKGPAPVQATFEPLTSPALGAQRSEDRRRSSSATFGPSEDNSSHNKRRTPHGTPILQANNKAKSSLTPTVKHISSSRNINTFEKLPESSINLSRSSVENTPMLPPQGKVVEISTNTSEPATLMGFTMGRLAEQKMDNSSTRPSKADRKSPVKYTAARKMSSKSSSDGEVSPVLSTENDQTPTSSKGKSEKPAAKKFSHKLAEQGRRNRMNMAVQELSNLIPKVYHDEVAIPSKATTVELASRYIEDLLREIEDLRKSQ